MINAGLGGTGSMYGALRAGRDLLAGLPDFVVVEFAVNDNWTDGEAFEGLVRQILAQPNSPAVLLLFMMWEKGGNDQEMQSIVGAHYLLPMVSFRDAIWPRAAMDAEGGPRMGLANLARAAPAVLALSDHHPPRALSAVQQEPVLKDRTDAAQLIPPALSSCAGENQLTLGARIPGAIAAGATFPDVKSRLPRMRVRPLHRWSRTG